MGESPSHTIVETSESLLPYSAKEISWLTNTRPVF